MRKRGGEVRVCVQCPCWQKPAFRQSCGNLCRGSARVKKERAKEVIGFEMRIGPWR